MLAFAKNLVQMRIAISSINDPMFLPWVEITVEHLSLEFPSYLLYYL